MTGMWERPKHHRATLIQAYRGFESYLEPALSQAMKHYGIEERERLDVIKWIISEEMWLVFNICDINHIRAASHLRVHDYITNALPFNLSACFKACFMMPTFNGWEFGVSVHVDKVGFYIRYYTDEDQPMRSNSKWN